jgi:hypothetical protein
MYHFLLNTIIYLQNIKHGEEFIGKAREVYIYKYLIDYYKKKLHRIKHIIIKDWPSKIQKMTLIIYSSSWSNNTEEHK